MLAKLFINDYFPTEDLKILVQFMFYIGITKFILIFYIYIYVDF